MHYRTIIPYLLRDLTNVVLLTFYLLNFSFKLLTFKRSRKAAASEKSGPPAVFPITEHIGKFVELSFINSTGRIKVRQIV